MNSKLCLEKYQDIVYFAAPIKIEVDSKLLIQYFDEHKKDVKTPASVSLWKGIQPISWAATSKKAKSEIDPDFQQSFPRLIPQIKELLPFLDIKMFHIWEQNIYVGPHQDSKAHDSNLFPSSYRIMLIKPEADSFFVDPFIGPNFIFDKATESTPRGIPSKQKNFIKIPDASNVFCFNNSACLHGAEKLNERKLIGFFEADLDYDRHLQLIETSIKKYPEFAIIKCTS